MGNFVFNIQRFSIHDGPGIRTTVFLQGCNLRCFWCHNPESNPVHPVVQFFPEKCILCMRCIEICREGAQRYESGMRIYERALCKACGRCVGECFARALTQAAKEMTPAEVMTEVDKDRDYYQESNGGVTFSGGDPLLQRDFLLDLLRVSKERGYHTAVDTAGNVPWGSLKEILPYTDLILYDVKVMDGQKHREATGVSNERILENLNRLAQEGARLWVRIPVIPAINDTKEDIAQIGAFLYTMRGIELVELLPFHHLGASKYESLGRVYAGESLQPPTEPDMEQLVQVLTGMGLNARRMI